LVETGNLPTYAADRICTLFTTVPEWATPDHAIMLVKFSSGVTIRQRVLNQVVNTSTIVVTEQCKPMMSLEQTETCFCSL